MPKRKPPVVEAPKDRIVVHVTSSITCDLKADLSRKWTGICPYCREPHTSETRSAVEKWLKKHLGTEHRLTQDKLL
jgi:hypothetical protein